jgi:hypothetical protein
MLVVGKPIPASGAVEVGPWHVKTLAEAIAETAAIHGWEYEITPLEAKTENVNIITATLGNVNVGRPRIGQFTGGIRGADKSNDIVFEFGTTMANVASYTYVVDRQQMATRVYVPRVGFPEPGRVGAAAHQIVTDSPSVAANGVMDAWVDPGEIELAADRLKLAQQHIALRKAPKRTITFTPVQNADHEPYVDYVVGDYVRFRAFDGNTMRLDVRVRIWGFTVTLDANGNESVSLTTIEEAP